MIAPPLQWQHGCIGSPNKPISSTTIIVAARLYRQPKQSEIFRCIKIGAPFIISEVTMEKDKILELLYISWESYQTKLIPNSYLYLYEKNGILKSKFVAARDYNFLHLSGIKTNLSAEMFARKLRKKSLKPKEFYLENKRNIKSKLYKLPSLHEVMEQPLKIGKKSNTLKNVDYIVGRNQMILGFSCANNGKGFDNPSTLMSGIWETIAAGKFYDILAVLKTPKQGQKLFDKVTYISDKFDYSKLPISIINKCDPKVLEHLKNGKISVENIAREKNDYELLNKLPTKEELQETNAYKKAELKYGKKIADSLVKNIINGSKHKKKQNSNQNEKKGPTK